MKKWIAVFFLFSSLGVWAQSKEEMAIRSALDYQVQAWNNGDVKSFMQGYWQNDSLLFIGKSGVSHGWQQTLANYQKGYPDKSAMGKLTFELLELRPLSPGYYFVVGKWHLERSIGDVGGHFSLLFKKINGQWFIIADHSS